MTVDSQLELTAEHESRLESIVDDVVEGIAEGAREGLAEGLKKAGREALKECLSPGTDKTGREDITDIIEAIPQAIIKASVKKGAQPILKKTAEKQLEQACRKLIEELKREAVAPSPELTAAIVEALEQSQREAVGRIVAQLPQNPLFGALADGMQSALEASLKKSLADCKQNIQEALA